MRVVRRLLLPWLLLAVLGSLWALATPIAGSPDEPAHVVKAASVVRGQLLPSAMVDGGGVVEVPAAIASENQQGCFAFYANIPASCAQPFAGDGSETVQTYTSASLYNPVYYWLVGWPSLVLPDIAGIYAMRIVSAVVTTFFLAATIWLVAAWRRPRVPTLGILVGITPMVLYLVGTVNPNALEFTAGLALFAAMLGIVLQPDPGRLVPRLALVVVAAALVSNSRGISPLWVAVLLLVPLILLTGRQLVTLLRRPAVTVSIALIVATAAASAWWTLSSNSLGTGPSTGPDVVPSNPGVGLSPVQGFFGLLGDLYGQVRQMVGVMGWLDTTLHPVVYLVYYALFALFAVGVVLWVRGRRLVFVIVLAAAFLLLPPLIQAFYVTRGGFIWQGRYTLVLLMALLLGMAAAIATSERFTDRLVTSGPGRAARLPRVLTILGWVVAAGWTFAVAYSFATTLRRFVSGYATDWPAMYEAGAWAPPLDPVLLISAFALVSAAFAVTVTLTAVRAERAPI